MAYEDLLTIDGKDFVRVGDKVLPVDRFEDGLPIIKATSTFKEYEDGRRDVTVHVPCLRIKQKKG